MAIKKYIWTCDGSKCDTSLGGVCPASCKGAELVDEDKYHIAPRPQDSSGSAGLALLRCEKCEWQPGAGGIDGCMQPLVDALNNAGVETVASCCGHGRRPGNIALRDGRELIICPDFETGRKIDKMFPSILAL